VFDLQKGQIFSLPSKCPTGCGVHTGSYLVGTGLFSRGNVTRCSAEVKFECSYTSSPLYAY
jgi:hypothetical protein